MKLAIAFVAVLLFLKEPGTHELQIDSEARLDFSIKPKNIFENRIQMYHALLDEDAALKSGNFNEIVSFEEDMLPLDIYKYFENRGDEQYYTLLTKTVYGFNQGVDFFSEERLSDEDYLQQIMPYNKVARVDGDYELQVGFGAPDITYSLEFYDNCGLTEKYPALARYFAEHDQVQTEPSLVVLQHNHTFGKVLGQKTSKMSVSITRYFEKELGKTLAINYTLSYIHNLPPVLLGGGNLLINQMKEGVIALVRDTRRVCQTGF